MKRIIASSVVLALLAVGSTAFGLCSVSDTGTWSKNWPRELETLRTQSRTQVGPTLAARHFAMRFNDRDEFEAAWPHILNVKNKGAPSDLVREPNFFLGKKQTEVVVHCPPEGQWENPKISGLVAFAMTHAQPDKTWMWSDRESNILSYVMRGSEKYDITLTRSAKDFEQWSINVSISAGGKTRFEWETHDEGTFAFSGDLLIYSNHHRNATGCEIRAVDLAEGTTLWSTQLKGVGPVEHSKYRNRINLSLSDGKITIYGNESSGQYIEILDLKSGETISNTLGRKSGQTF